VNIVNRLIPKTLKRKLQITLFAIGFFPYLFILIYIHNLGEEKILNDTLATRHVGLHRVKEHIEDQLLHISREVVFLSSLDMMNDIIIGDIDIDIDILAIDNDQKIVASTATDKEHFKYYKMIQKSKRADKNYFFTKSDILDIAQIEAGKTVAVPMRVTVEEIEEIVLEVISMLELLAEDTEISFRNYIKSCQEYFTVDKKLLKQIVINLLSNSIKFTDNGTIDIAMRRDRDRLQITIEDSGVGISQENLSKLFNSFTQIKSKNSREHKGSGLGLGISKKLAHLFGADIELDSRGEGYGTKATIEVKLHREYSGDLHNPNI